MNRTVVIGAAGAFIIASALVLSLSIDSVPETEETVAESTETGAGAQDVQPAQNADSVSQVEPPVEPVELPSQPEEDASDSQVALVTPTPTEPTPTEPVSPKPVPKEPAPTEPAPTEPASTEPVPKQPAPKQVESQPRDDGETVNEAAKVPPDEPDDENGASTPLPPSFDVVRIDPSGDAVFAGRAEPGSEVTVLDGDSGIGTVASDGRGEWVFLPTSPLAPGPHELRLRARLADGSMIMSDGAVVMVVPKPGQDIAGRPAPEEEEPQQPLVVLIPDEDKVGAELIQRPNDTPAGEVAEDAAPADAVASLPSETAALPSATTAEPSGVQTDDGSMSVETIDYDSAGNVAITGTGPRETMIVAYLDGAPIGSGRVDGERRWRIMPEGEVAPGIYRMRLDAVAGDRVTARLEIPFSRAAPITDLQGDAFIVVQPGNSLWRIARRTLGDGVNYTVIYEANEDQIRDPDLIYPGQVFEIPR